MPADGPATGPGVKECRMDAVVLAGRPEFQSVLAVADATLTGRVEEKRHSSPASCSGENS